MKNVIKKIFSTDKKENKDKKESKSENDENTPLRAKAKKNIKKTSSSKSAKKVTKKKSTSKTAAKSAAKASYKAGDKKEKKEVTSKKSAVKKSTVKKAASKKQASKKTTAKKNAAKTSSKIDIKTSMKNKKTIKNIKKNPFSNKLAKKEKVNIGVVKTKDLPKNKNMHKLSKLKSSQTNDNMTMKKNIDTKGLPFSVDDYIVYPAHGVGQITEIVSQKVTNIEIELYVIYFQQDKLKLRVPINKAENIGMRPLSSAQKIGEIFTILKGRARVKRSMWSRRAQEYEAKINSGNIELLAEVVRDLFRSNDQPEQSYSERQLYEIAVERMAREIALAYESDYDSSLKMIEETLGKRSKIA